MGFMEKIFGTHSSREIKRIMSTVEDIESLESQIEKLTDDELKRKKAEFKKRI